MQRNQKNDAIDQITGAKGLLNVIIAAATDDDGIGDAALAAHDRLWRAMEILDKPDEDNSAILQDTPQVDAPKMSPAPTLSKQATRHDYLNRSFIPNGVDAEYCEKHRASSLAADVWAMLAVIEAAFDAECEGGDGVSTSLQIAKYMAGDLIEMVELLERG